ncbi:MAG: outer membrane beta-barrel protein, partial [Prolixibacteraceae bacterium]
MDKNTIDQLFKEKLGNFEENPPVGLLGQINEQMVFKSKVRRLNQVKTVIGIAAALLIAVVAGWYSTDQKQFSDNKIPAQMNQVISPENTVSSKKSAILPVPEKQLLADQSKQVVMNGSIHAKKSHILSLYKNKGSAASDTKTAMVPPKADKEQGKTVLQENVNATKEDKKSEQGSKTRQKNAEPLYFANSDLTPSSSSGRSVKGAWKVKAEVSPMFAPQIQGANSGTKSMGTVSGGMMASYKLNDKISISTGVRYSQIKQGTHTDYTLSAKSGITYLEPVEKKANISNEVVLYLPSASSIVYSNGMQAVASNGIQSAASNVFGSDVSQDFKYLEIPIQATYKLIDNAISVGLTGGISTNILIGNKASIVENGILLSKGNTNNLRDVLYSGSAGIEFGYSLGKNLVLTVEPRLKQYLHSMSSNDQINFKPLQMGVFTGL